MIKSKSFFLLVSVSLLFLCCSTDGGVLEEPFDFSKEILGEWQQVERFDLQDNGQTPPAFEWVKVENGFLLNIFDDGTFEYFKFQDCTTGEYVYDEISSNIDFYFECEVDFNGEIVSEIRENFLKHWQESEYLTLNHLTQDCVQECSSLLVRVN